MSSVLSVPPLVRAGIAQEVYGGVSVRVWAQEGDSFRSGPVPTATWQARWGALCRAALHIWDWESCSLNPGMIYHHSDRNVDKKTVCCGLIIIFCFCFSLRGCIAWVGPSLASRSSVRPLRRKRSRWTSLTSHHMTSPRSLNTSSRRYRSHCQINLTEWIRLLIREVSVRLPFSLISVSNLSSPHSLPAPRALTNLWPVQ